MFFEVIRVFLFFLSRSTFFWIITKVKEKNIHKQYEVQRKHPQIVCKIKNEMMIQVTAACQQGEHFRIGHTHTVMPLSNVYCVYFPPHTHSKSMVYIFCFFNVRVHVCVKIHWSSSVKIHNNDDGDEYDHIRSNSLNVAKQKKK